MLGFCCLFLYGRGSQGPSDVQRPGPFGQGGGVFVCPLRPFFHTHVFVFPRPRFLLFFSQSSGPDTLRMASCSVKKQQETNYESHESVFFWECFLETVPLHFAIFQGSVCLNFFFSRRVFCNELWNWSPGGFWGAFLAQKCPVYVPTTAKR